MNMACALNILHLALLFLLEPYAFAQSLLVRWRRTRIDRRACGCTGRRRPEKRMYGPHDEARGQADDGAAQARDGEEDVEGVEVVCEGADDGERGEERDGEDGGCEVVERGEEVEGSAEEEGEGREEEREEEGGELEGVVEEGGGRGEDGAGDVDDGRLGGG